MEDIKNFVCRKVQITDIPALLELYKVVAAQDGGIARNHYEITEKYVEYNTIQAIKHGIGLVVTPKDKPNWVVAEVHSYQLVPQVFRHILSELTIVVHPDYQGGGLGKLLFSNLLDLVMKNRKDILRIELIARESNVKAIKLYEDLGFVKEGRLEKRILNTHKEFEADIPMAWLNPNFEQPL